MTVPAVIHGDRNTMSYRSSPRLNRRPAVGDEAARINRGTSSCKGGRMCAPLPQSEKAKRASGLSSQPSSANNSFAPSVRTTGLPKVKEARGNVGASRSPSVTCRSSVRLRLSQKVPAPPSPTPLTSFPASPRCTPWRPRGWHIPSGVVSTFDDKGVNSCRGPGDAACSSGASGGTVSTCAGNGHIHSRGASSSGDSSENAVVDVCSSPHAHAATFAPPPRTAPWVLRRNSAATLAQSACRSPGQRHTSNSPRRSVVQSCRTAHVNANDVRHASTAQLHPCDADTSPQVEKQGLLALMSDSERLIQVARATLRRYDTDGDGLLSLIELERMLPKLHERFHLLRRGVHEDIRSVARKRMRKFDFHGDGFLRESGFVSLFRWTIWRRYEELNPLSLTRASLVDGVHQTTCMKRYTVGEQIGSGNFGKIRVAVNQASGFERVIKSIPCQSKEIPDGLPQSKPMGEVKILGLLDHPHILRVYESILVGGDVHIITDFCAGGDLFDIIRENTLDGETCPEPLAIRIFKQVLQAVSHCHGAGVMHKDLKFENIMLRRRLTRASSAEEVHVVVIDMGLSELFGKQHGCSSRSSAACGTLVTMAPEVIAHDFSCKCDIWSIGCLIFAMLNSQPRRSQKINGQVTIDQFPFAVQPTDDDPLGLHCLLANQSRGPDFMQLAVATQDAVFAVKAMLSFEEVDRPTAFDCLQLPWFRSVPDRCPRRLSHAQVQTLVERSKRELRMFSDALVAKAASQLPSSKLTVMEEQFKAIDVNCKGFITRSEMVHELLVLHVARHEADRIADMMDLNKSGVINWSDFVASLLPSAEELLTEGLAAFLSMQDFGDDGLVSAVELGSNVLKTGCDDAASKFAAEIFMKELRHDGADKLNLDDIKRLALGRESSGVGRSTMASRRPFVQADFARTSSIGGRFPQA